MVYNVGLLYGFVWFLNGIDNNGFIYIYMYIHVYIYMAYMAYMVLNRDYIGIMMGYYWDIDGYTLW